MTLPVRVIALKDDTAIVADGSAQFEVGRRLAADVRPGDWALVHAGQLVGRVPSDEVAALRALWDEITAFREAAEPQA